MSKYSGLFLSFLLMMICLWINICRYPHVWVMLNGDYPLHNEQQTPDEISPAETPESSEGGLVTQNGSKTFDIDAEPTYGVPASRGPLPVVLPVSQPKVKNSSGEKPKPKKKASDKGDQYFRPATLSKSVDEPSPEENDADTQDSESPSESQNEESADNLIGVGPSPYSAPGSPGTIPMNAERPTYAGLAVKEPPKAVYRTTVAGE